MNNTQSIINEIYELMGSIKSHSTNIDVLENLMNHQQSLILKLKSDNASELENIKNCLHHIKAEYVALISEFKSRAADIKTSLINVNFIKKYLDN